MADHVARMEEDKCTVKGTLGRPRRRWEENIGMDLKEIGVNMRKWVDSA